MKTHLQTLRAAFDAIEGYRAELQTVPAADWPKGWDSVVVAEHLSTLAHDVHDHDRGADIPAYGVKGIAAVPAYLGSFWHTVEALTRASDGGEPVAVRAYMDTAARVLREAIEDHGPEALFLPRA